MNKKIATWLIAGACIGLLVQYAQATPTLTLSVDPSITSPGTTPFVLGDINPDNPASPANESVFIQAMIGLALGGHSQVTAGSQTDDVYRSMNAFSGLSGIGAQIGSTSTTIPFTLSAGNYIIAAKYDGPNGAAEVWFLTLTQTTSVTIPQNAFGNNNSQYGLSGINTYNATTSLPDGGATIALLGLALTSLGLVRSKLS